MADKPNILVVEDDEFVRTLLAAYLEKDGYRITAVGTAKAMHEALDRGKVALILLDLGLPDEDGLALLRQLRTRSQIPIMVLTARQARDDRIAGLQAGADDYVTKPVDPEELCLRVGNVLRRVGAVPERDRRDVFAFQGWTLDVSGGTLRGPDGAEARLTRAEFDVLAALARAPDRVLSRDHLLDAVSRDDDTPSDRLIDVLVSRLRKKIEADPRHPKIIHTAVGRGYRLATS